MAPENVTGYIKWVSSFSLTEYDYALSIYPLISLKNGDRKKVNLIVSHNPFISKNDNFPNSQRGKRSPKVINFGFSEKTN